MKEKKKVSFSTLMQSKIAWAVIAELLILLIAGIIRPDFFSIKYQPATGMLYGSLIDSSVLLRKPHGTETKS